MNINQVTNWKGDIGRRDYLIWGVFLFAVKYNLDRLTVHIVMGRSWFFTDYFTQTDNLSLLDLDSGQKRFYLLLVLQSLPFIWFGTVLCLKRLRSAALPNWLVIFFFLPFVNLFMFLILAAIPESKRQETKTSNKWLRFIPKSKLGSALLSVGVITFIALVLVVFQINYLNDHGWSLFVGVPFLLGFGSVLFYGFDKRITIRDAIVLALLSTVVFGLVVFILAFEGIICLLMAFPIFTGVAMIGAAVGYAINSTQKTSALNVLVAPVLLVAATSLLETNERFSAPTIAVSTKIIVNASKQEVWDEVVAFSKIEEPTEWIFKTGIAYPTHAEIDRKGIGAIRKCNFTTGCFVEPITIWNEPDLLEFTVRDQPPPMIEWSIYKDMNIPHLEGYFKSVKGQFKLEQMEDGNTLLTGTTWYHHNVWPSFYWRLWSDNILHRIHLRVLKHIKSKVEKKIVLVK